MTSRCSSRTTADLSCMRWSAPRKRGAAPTPHRCRGMPANAQSATNAELARGGVERLGDLVGSRDGHGDLAAVPPRSSFMSTGQPC
jgi:hypothetical protein